MRPTMRPILFLSPPLVFRAMIPSLPIASVSVAAGTPSRMTIEHRIDADSSSGEHRELITRRSTRLRKANRGIAFVEKRRPMTPKAALPQNSPPGTSDKICPRVSATTAGRPPPPPPPPCGGRVERNFQIEPKLDASKAGEPRDAGFTGRLWQGWEL